MYLVKIINEGKEVIANQISTNDKNRIRGTVKQGINCINSFSFTIHPNNDCYSLIFPYKTLVTVYNTKLNKYEFRGRVLTVTGDMDSNGVISKSVVCESELGYLCDSVQTYGEFHNITITDYLSLILEKHNENLEEEKHYELGDITVTDNNDSLYRYLAYDTSWNNIQSDLINKLGGELQVRNEEGGRYLDYLTEIGKTCATEISLGKNIKEITEEKQDTEYYTRLIPLGAKLKTTDDEGNETDTEERLTIAEVNNGVNYIDDKEGIKQLGIIQGIVTWDDVTTTESLLAKAKTYLATQRITVSNKISAFDLSLIGLDVEDFVVGNYYPVRHELLGIDDVVRVVEKSISIDNPHETEITLGTKEYDIKEQFKNSEASISQLSQQVAIATKKIDSVQKTVNDMQTDEEGDPSDSNAPGEESGEPQDFAYAEEFCSLLENWYSKRDTLLTYGQTNAFTSGGSKTWTQVTTTGTDSPDGLYRHIDCSGLVGACWRGITFEELYENKEAYDNKGLSARTSYSWTENPPRTAAEQCQWAREKGYEVPPDILHTSGTTDFANLKRGDIIYRGGKNNGRYLGVYHVEVYLGERMVIEATSSKNVSKHTDGVTKGLQKISLDKKGYSDIVCVIRIQK